MPQSAAVSDRSDKKFAEPGFPDSANSLITDF